MIEYNDINLPADFDDLSKHAPLLDKLRAKGDGLVVPENYFSEQEELSLATYHLSLVTKNEAGFIIPENYFSELVERIILIVNLSELNNNLNADDLQSQSDNCFTVPDGYFEKLTEEILAVANLSSIKNTESFEIPEGYFNEFDNELHTTIALDNLKQDEGFKVPNSYFENLSTKIISRVATDELNQGFDKDVPSGYFDTLADRISTRIKEEEKTENVAPELIVERGRIIVFAEIVKRYARPVSIAASVTLLISASIWFFIQNENHKTKTEFVNNSKQKQNISPVIAPIQKQDSVIAPKENVVAVEKPNKHNSNLKLNHPQDHIVKQLDKKDVMSQLDLLDESVVADFISDKNPNLKNIPQEEYLNDPMLNYILDNNADASDINK